MAERVDMRADMVEHPDEVRLEREADGRNFQPAGAILMVDDGWAA
jgi:hypothetical protein